MIFRIGYSKRYQKYYIHEITSKSMYKANYQVKDIKEYDSTMKVLWENFNEEKIVYVGY
jgi:hypothetical protein